MSSAGGGFTMSGTGTLTLSGNNTFSGTLSATSGTVSISSIGNVGVASAAGAGSTINIGGTALNGVLLYTGSAATSNKTINLASGNTYSSTITQNGTGLLKFTSDFTATTGGNKTLILNGSGLGEIAGAIVNNTGNLTSLTKTGDGSWNLSGNNTYSGATTISGGTLQFAKTASLYNGATASWTAPNIIVNSGGTLALNVGGAGEFTSANVDMLDSLGGASNGFRSNSTLALDTTNAGGSFTHSGNISNTNSGSNVLNLTKLGAGTLTLTGNNTYTGATTITAGTLQISSAGRLGGGSYSGNIINSGTFIYAGTNNQTLSGVISGTGALTQNGTGTLTLTGNNTYTGTTAINSGTLQAAASGATGNSTVINVNGGSFLVTAANAVNDNAAINLGGGRMAVSGNFSETVGALTLSANSTIDFSGFVGTLRFGSIASWTAGANLAIWNWSGRTQYGTDFGTYPNSSNLVFTNTTTALTNNLANISFFSGSGSGFIGNGFEVTGFTGGGSEIIAVPETETYFYAVALLAGLVVQYLRRRAKRKSSKGHRPEFVTRATARQGDRLPW
jgi:autotransporter-associated beta strand protein